MHNIKNKHILVVVMMSIILGLYSVSLSHAKVANYHNDTFDRLIKQRCKVDTNANAVFYSNLKIQSDNERPSTVNVKMVVRDGKIIFNQRIDVVSVIDITGRTIVRATNVNEVYFPCNRGIYIISTVKGRNINTFKVKL